MFVINCWVSKLSVSMICLVYIALSLFRYASLRRRLLVDPHISKDGRNSPDLAVDNPLSQNPGYISDIFLMLSGLVFNNS